jgi:hypothetical protein
MKKAHRGTELVFGKHIGIDLPFPGGGEYGGGAGHWKKTTSFPVSPD